MAPYHRPSREPTRTFRRRCRIICRMNSPPAPSSKRKIYLDPKHSLALAHLLVEEKIFEDTTPIAFNQLHTIGDLVVHRNPSTFHVTAQDKREIGRASCRERV